MKKKFEYFVGARVELAMSKEKGRVIARAKYETGMRQYLVRYVAADGRQVEGWFESDAIHKRNALLEILGALPPSSGIGSAKLKPEPWKHQAKELLETNKQLAALSSSVAALQNEVSSLSAQLNSTTAALSGRAVAQ